MENKKDEQIVIEKKESKFKFIHNFEKKHPEFFKFIKFFIAGGLSSVIEIIVHMILLATVFKTLNEKEPTSSFLLALNIKSIGYMWSFFISTSIGYAIAFIINRKVTFRADSNKLISVSVYIVMVVGTVIFNTWLGAVLGSQLNIAISSGAVNQSLKGFLSLLIKILLVAVPTLWTYPINRFIIHRKKKDKTVKEDIQ